MKIIGCDLHARQQTVAMLDTTRGEVVRMTLTHEGNNVREFYSTLPTEAWERMLPGWNLSRAHSFLPSAAVGYRSYPRR
jgi:hypothetical protein